MVVTPIYAGILALLQIKFAFGVINQRRTKKVSLGQGDGSPEQHDLQVAVRTFGNFTDYVPMALVLLLLLELSGVWQIVLHGLGIMLVAGRLFHASGLKATELPFTNRVRGMQLTFAVLAISAALAIAIGLWRMLQSVL